MLSEWFIDVPGPELAIFSFRKALNRKGRKDYAKVAKTSDYTEQDRT